MTGAVPTGGDSGALRRRHLPLLILGFVSLATGVAAGLARLGWMLPLPQGDLALLHGPLMVCGFFGTVIALERAVAVGRLWVYGGPLLAGAGGLALVGGAPSAAGGALLSGGGLVLLAASLEVWRRHPAAFTAVLALGAACWPVGTAVWLVGGTAGIPATGAVAWWMLFLVLTIAGERLELSRFRPPSRWAGPVFQMVAAGLIGGAALAVFAPDAGFRLLGMAAAALALWLFRFDVARRTVRLAGLPRFTAVCLLSGYAWLAVGGALAVLGPDPATGPLADAVLHAVFVGFVLAMVFGHAPIILPAVLRFAVPYRPALYLPLAALHAGLMLRVAGVLTENAVLRQWGGLGNGLALALFIATMLTVILGGRRPAIGATPGTAATRAPS